MKVDLLCSVRLHTIVSLSNSNIEVYSCQEIMDIRTYLYSDYLGANTGIIAAVVVIVVILLLVVILTVVVAVLLRIRRHKCKFLFLLFRISNMSNM